jgi:hypothetical protein
MSHPVKEQETTPSSPTTCCDTVLLSTCCGHETKASCCGPEAAPVVCGCGSSASGTAATTSRNVRR